MKRTYRILFFALVLFSCKGHQMSEPSCSAQYKSIDIPLEGKKYLASQLFDGCQIVELDTSKDSYIANIDRIYRDNRFIYILDNRLHAVFIFDLGGKFIRRFYEIGRGPGEYIQLSDFLVDNRGRIYLMADIPEKLIIRDSDGGMLEQRPLNESYMDFCITEKNFVFANPPFSETSFSMQDTMTRNLKTGLCALPAYNSTFIRGRFLTDTDGKIVLVRRFDNRIYSIENEEIVVLGEIHFKDASFITKSELKEFGDSNKFFDSCRDNNRIFSFVDFQIMDDIWVYNTNLPFCSIYSSTSGKIYTISFLDDQEKQIHLGGHSRIAINGKTNREVCFVLKQEALRQMGKKETDNPILFFYHLRNDL